MTDQIRRVVEVVAKRLSRKMSKKEQERANMGEFLCPFDIGMGCSLKEEDCPWSSMIKRPRAFIKKCWKKSFKRIRKGRKDG